MNQNPADPLFAFDRCSVVFGGLTAVREVSFQVRDREMVGLIGPNGAGKTTIFNLATGVYNPTSGRVLYQGRQIAGPKRSKEGAKTVSLGRKRISRLGICRTFQNIRLFGGLTVLENVLVAGNSRHAETLSAAMLRMGSFYRHERANHEAAMELLRALHLDELAGAEARSLPYGPQRRLEIARALATRPKLLLLDEPAAGMNPNESSELMEMIRWVRQQFQLTILLIEHDMKVVMGICERILVLNEGALIADGLPAEVRRSRDVIAAYLGEEA